VLFSMRWWILPAAEPAHMSDPCGACAEFRGTVESRPTVETAAAVEPGEAMEAASAKTVAGEPAEGIAVTVIRPVIPTRPVIVPRPSLGIVAAARRETAVIRGHGVTGRTGRARYGRGGP